MNLEALKARFEAKYERGEPDDCWEWRGYRDPHGYGSLKIPLLGERRAHRISYRLYRGDIPKGMVICHACDNPPCVNPDHLWTGTHADNVQDRVQKNRSATRKPTLGKLTDQNVRDIRRRYQNGERQCALAIEFNIHSSTISNIISRKRYRAVSDD